MQRNSRRIRGEAVTKWISVEKELPKHDGEVKVLCGDGDKEIGWLDGRDTWWIGNTRMSGMSPACTVTHWAEIEWPEPPEEANP